MNDHTPSVTPHSDYGGGLITQQQRLVLRCSFCGLGEGEVARLFEGHSGYICDECVDVCVQLLHDYREMGIRPPKSSQPWYKKLWGDDNSHVGQCSFNIHDRNNPQGARLFAGISAQICDKCVRACEVLKSSLVLGS
jgi:ATP-dependent protease Clp ATPase subunit